MKKLIMILLASHFFNASAQLNLNFEYWSKVQTINSPADWLTINLFGSFGDSVSCIQSNDAYSGKYSAKVRSIKYSGVILPGQLIQRYVSSERPKSLRFAYKFVGARKDTGAATLAFYKGAINNLNNIVGSISIDLDTTSKWRYVTYDIQWTKPDAPDTVILGFFTGRFSTKQWLYIDDVSISNYAAEISQKNNPETGVAINNKIVSFAGFSNNNFQFTLYNASGLLVKNFNIRSRETCDLSNLADGIYFYRINISDGITKHFSGKIMLRE